MSKNFRKYFFNNLKESKYLSNIERVEFDRTKTDGNDLLSDNELQKRKEQLDFIQIYNRHNNLRIYVKNMYKYRIDQVLSLVAPTVLVVSTVASFVAPYRRVVDKKFSHTYVKESTVLSNTQGQVSDSNEIYYYDDGFFSLNEDNFVKENEDNFYSSYQNNLTYQISDGVDCVLAKFDYNDDGKLTFNGVDVGKYIDVGEYNFAESSSIDKKYERLFDDVLNMILEQDDLSVEEKEVLKKIAESEKSNIIINIVNYENIGESTTQVYKSRFWQRVILLLATAFYGCILYAFCKDGDATKGTKLMVDDGVLYEKANQNIGFWHVGLKYKETFIKAEVERIKNAYELANEYILDSDVNDLFTNFEKKLVLREKKER